MKLSVAEFGKELLKTLDLDPVYVLLWNAQMERDLLERWLLAYWCFYHVGTASWITDAKDEYWQRMLTAAGSKEYPRSTERRHYRGQFAIKSVEYLKEAGFENLLSPISGRRITLSQVIKYVKGWYGFGAWIAFKVADMLERLDISQVMFDTTDAFLFDSPRKGAIMAFEMEHERSARNGEAETWALETLTQSLGSYLAPPRYERLINAQEVETTLCKWKSYMGRHYKLGEDIESCQRALNTFPECSISRRLMDAGGVGGLW